MPVFAFLLLLLAGTAAPAGSPDLLLEGGTVYASPAEAGRPASILVRDGKIAFVGDPSEARSRAPSAMRVDLTGRFVFAGWADAHGHLEGLGQALESANLRGSASASEAARRMAAKSVALPSGAWVTGRGWDQNLWAEHRFPDARDLDTAVPDRPATAGRVDGHAIWVNTKALEAAGITRETADPPGGRILRRSDGTPSGVLVDNAMDLVSRVLPAPTPADRERRLLAAMRACASAGLTEVQDASGYGPESLEVLERLDARGALPIRVYATVSPEPERLRDSFARGVRVAKGAQRLTVRAIKAYADGALGSRGAALLEDYSDEPGRRGLLVTPAERLEEVARDARRNGWQLWIHAIGDRGNRIALDAFRRAAQTVPDAPAGGTRPRIEHAQVVALSDIPRFGSEGVIASIQPTHATSDMPWAEQRVGPERIRGAYAWQRLKKSGARLAGGSDFPVESEKPVEGFYAAITRHDPDGKPEGGWRPEERLTRAEALALFTTDAAWAAFEEERRGKIVPGFDADFTVLPEDPMAVSPARIRNLSIVATIVGGEIVAGSIRGAVP